MEHNSAIRTYMAIMAERDAAVRERNVALDERRRAFAERDMAMLQRDAAITERNTAVEERDKAIHALQVEDNNIMYENEMNHNYNLSHMSEHGYDPPNQMHINSHDVEDVKPRKTETNKEANGGSSSLTKKSDAGKQVKGGSSKVWGSDALNMMM